MSIHKICNSIEFSNYVLCLPTNDNDNDTDNIYIRYLLHAGLTNIYVDPCFNSHILASLTKNIINSKKKIKCLSADNYYFMPLSRTNNVFKCECNSEALASYYLELLVANNDAQGIEIMKNNPTKLIISNCINKYLLIDLCHIVTSYLSISFKSNDVLRVDTTESGRYCLVLNNERNNAHVVEIGILDFKYIQDIMQI